IDFLLITPSIHISSIAVTAYQSHLVCQLRPGAGRIAAAPFLRRLDGDVPERNLPGVLHLFGHIDATKRAVGEADLINHGAGEAGDPHHARARSALHVFDHDVADDGAVRPGSPRFVKEIYPQDRFGPAAALDVTHKDVLDAAPAAGVRFEAQRAFQVRAVHPAVLDKHVAHAARHLAAHHDAAVPILHRAVADDYVFSGRGDAAAVVVAPGLDRDAIVARVKDAVLDQHVAARFRVAAVVVRAVADDGDAAHGDVLAEYRVDFPHRRVVDRHALNQHVARAVRLDEAGPQAIARPEDALRDRDAPLIEIEQPFDAARPFLRLAPAFGPRPPVFNRGRAVEYTPARDCDVLLLEGVDERRVVHALGAFKPREDDGQILLRVGNKFERRAFGDVQVDMAPEVDRAREEDARRHEDAPAARGVTGRDGFADRFGVVGFTVGSRAVIGDPEVALRECRRLDPAQNGGQLRPPFICRPCLAAGHGHRAEHDDCAEQSAK